MTRHGGSAALALVLLLLTACSRQQDSGYQGYVEGEFVNVAAAESGRLDRLSVARGDAVANGAPLFVLESGREAAAQRQAQQQLASAQAQLADLQRGKRPQEIEVTRAQLAQAEVEAKRSARQLARDRIQIAADAISHEQLDNSAAAAEADAARVRELQGQIEVARLASRDDQIRAQTAQVAAARAALEQAQWTLDQKAVRAPVGGLVSNTLYREGEWVAAGMPIARLLPPGNIKLRFFVPETVLGSLATGRALRVACDGCRNPVPAHIRYISPEAEYTPPVIYSNETRAKLVFMVEAVPESGHAAALHPGQPVQVWLQ